MNVMELLTSAVEQNAADIFLIPGMPFSYKIGGRIIYQGDNRIMPDEMDKMITEIYGLAKNRDMDKVQSHGDDDFSFAIPGVSRFRASVFRQRGSRTTSSAGQYHRRIQAYQGNGTGDRTGRQRQKHDPGLYY